MTWMLTVTGVTVDLRYMDSSTIDILDIAQGLSQINRFTGQASRPYSVAEHSLFVVQLLERRGVTSPHVLMAALLHDAHEAYFGDMSTPLKQMLDQATGGALRLEERRVQMAVLRHFHVLVPSSACGDLVRWADLTALSTERRALMPASPVVWPVTESHPPVDWMDFDAAADFDWQHWRTAFLRKFSELSERRQHSTEGLEVHG